MNFKKLFSAFMNSGANTGEGEKPKGSKWAFKGKEKPKAKAK